VASPSNSSGPNSDGCDPECCDGVVITGCSFNTGDDCVDDRRLPVAQNVSDLALTNVTVGGVPVTG
jgi:hypothetical protein